MKSNDEFLYQLRAQPSEEFGESLYDSLSKLDHKRSFFSGWGIAKIAAMAALVILISTTVIPGAWASILNTIKQVAGIAFEETEEYPGDGSESIISSISMPLEEAQEEFRFEIPESAPEGFSLDRSVIIGYLPEANEPHIEVKWLNQSGHSINLTVGPSGYTMVVGPGSVERIEVGGKEFALWHGGWNYNASEWDNNIDAITLSWSDEEWEYHLMGIGDDITKEDLMAMVQSMP
jgi:hypothetical protein